MQAIAEPHDLDLERFRHDVAGAYRPAVLRGFARDWPAVRAAGLGVEAIADYLRCRDIGEPVDAILLAPEERGRIFYDRELTGFNFVRRQLPLSAVIEQVLRYARFDAPPSVAVQSAPIARCAPAFGLENVAPFLAPSIAPRIWLGNAIVTPAHFDESANVAVVVAGRRRFTLLPPEQAANLYVGPLDFAPTGTPLSLVDFRAPDLARFPRFAAALSHAQVAELGPGDALYIPPLWWHHVESLERFNVLVNYWWHGPFDAPVSATSMFDALIHALLGLDGASAERRRAWRALFDALVFERAVDHLPAARRALHEGMSAEQRGRIVALLAAKLRVGT